MALDGNDTREWTSSIVFVFCFSSNLVNDKGLESRDGNGERDGRKKSWGRGLDLEWQRTAVMAGFKP